MFYKIAADFVVLLHFGFILFVVLGGLLVFKWPKAAWFHLPAAGWGALVVMMGWICPLTPLENWLLQQAGLGGYEGGFIDRYIMPLIYPNDLTRNFQASMGIIVLAINGVIYGLWIVRGKHRY